MAKSILQVGGEGLLDGVARRPEGIEPNLDFVLEDGNGKTVVYAEIKTPRSPQLRSISLQAEDISQKILMYGDLVSGRIQVIVDLKNLGAVDQSSFIADLAAKGLSSSRNIIFLNAL